MDADAAALQRFTDVPYVIEAPASGGRMASAAAAVMAGYQVRFDETGLTDVKYRAVIADARSQIDKGLPLPANYRIDVFDRSAKDLKGEGKRIDRTLSGFAKHLHGGPGEGAFAWPYQKGKGMGCVVTGFPASTDVQEFFSNPVGGQPVNLRGMTAENFHWITLRHELGHCLLGNSEVKADTFAALMAIRDGKMGANDLSVLASFREISEWVNENPDDPYFISASLWNVVGRADALKADKRFMAMSIEEVAEVARGIADRYGLTPDQLKAAQDTRRAFLTATNLPGHSVKEDGKRHPADLQDWSRANQDMPELVRLHAVMENLVSGAMPMEPFKYDIAAMKVRLADKARDGDPTSRAMLRTLAVPHKALKDQYPDFVKDIPVAKGNAFVDLAGLAAPEREAELVTVGYGGR